MPFSSTDRSIIIDRHEMNAKPVNDTETTTDDEPYSPKPFIDYLILMIKILIWFILFCFITTNNYLNVQGFVPAEYPVGNTLTNLPKSPYCCRFIECNKVSVSAHYGWADNVSKLPWWIQTTQESCYRIMGWVLHHYYKTIYWGIGGENKIPYNDIIPFIKWFLFGLATLFSIGMMLGFVWLIFIPGWVGGLFAYRPLNARGWWYIVSALLTLFFGFISIFPVIYEFFHLIYLFFFKQLVLAGKSGNSSNLSEEFTKRMSNWTIVYVIVAVIVAAIQLPTISATVIIGMVLLAFIFKKNKSVYKPT